MTGDARGAELCDAARALSPAVALLLMLASAAIHAAWNTALRRHPDAPAGGLLFLLSGAAFTGLLAIVDAGFVERAHQLRLSLVWGLAAGASEGFYLMALSRALSIGPLAAVYAVSRGAPLLILWPLSHFLLGEPITATAVLAVAVLLAGVGVLLPSRAGGHTTTRVGYVWAVITAAFNCTNSLVYKAALNDGAAVLPLFAVGLVVAFPIAASVLAPWGRGFIHAASLRLRAAFHVQPRAVGLGGIGFAASFLLALFTMRWQGAAWVLTMRNVSIAFAPLVAWIFLHEHPSRRAIAGVVLVFAGAFILRLA